MTEKTKAVSNKDHPQPGLVAWSYSRCKQPSILRTHNAGQSPIPWGCQNPSNSAPSSTPLTPCLRSQKSHFLKNRGWLEQVRGSG